MEIILKNVNLKINDELFFENINTSFKDNSITGIIGPVGSGKSLLLELISNLRELDGGKICVGNIEIERKTRKKDIRALHEEVGILFQSSYDQIYNLTVKKEMFLSLSDLKISQKVMNERIVNALKLVELDESYLDRSPFNLSQSELRRVALASVLVRNPSIILLDEPTAGLDVNTKKMLVNLLKILRKKHDKTIIIASSDIDFINQVADDIIVIKQGKIIVEGSRLTVFKNEKHLVDNGLKVPKIIEFENYVLKEKGIKLGYREEINDLLKDIFRYAK